MDKSSFLKTLALNLAVIGLAFAVGRLVASVHTESNAMAKAPSLAKATGMPKNKSNDNASGPVEDTSSSDQQIPPPDYLEKAKALKIQLASQGARPASGQALDRLVDTLLALAAIDPKAAMSFAQKQLHPPFQDQAINKILDIWAKADPSNAWDWVKTQAVDNDLFPGTVLKGIAQSQPETAWKFASELAPEKPMAAAGLYVSAMNGMIQSKNYETAARLLDSAILPDKARNSDYGLAAFLAARWGEYAPEQAAAWVLSLPQNSRDWKQSVVALSESWSRVDPAGAADFATRLPPGSERVTALTAAVDEWFTKAPEQLNAWVANAPHDNNYDDFAAAVASAPQIMTNGPDTAIAWAQTISNPELQIDTLTKVFDHWIDLNDQRAIAYLKNSSSLLPPIKAKILSRLNIPNL